MNNNIQELIIACVLVLLVIFLANPFDWLMLSHYAMMLIVLFAVVFSIFAVYIWRESAEDEREHAHRMLAGRYAFLAGSGVAACGIIIETFRYHVIDPWLVGTLIAMIFAKIVGLAYARRKQ